MFLFQLFSTHADVILLECVLPSLTAEIDEYAAFRDSHDNFYSMAEDLI